jgi:Eco57I restriction-modification methylase
VLRDLCQGRLEDWKLLAGSDQRLEHSLERLHALLSEASDLGSLIDPWQEADGNLLSAEFEQVRPLLQKALAVEHEQEGSGLVFGFAALGALRAAELLSRTYTLVVTNAPYLGSGKQAGTLKAYLERYFSEGKADLATAFLQRCFEFCDPDGSVGLVLPQNSLFLKSFSALRKQLLTRDLARMRSET